MQTQYIELESLSAKRWLVNIAHILIIEERISFTESEKARLPELKHIKSCCTITLYGSNETFWVKNSYSDIRTKLTQNDKKPTTTQEY